MRVEHKRLQILIVQGCYVGFGSGRCHVCTIRVKNPGSIEPVNDMPDGGPFDLAAGMWTNSPI